MCCSQRRQRGVTLVELIVAIVALGFGMVLLSTLIFPQAGKSVTPIQQSRAAELGQALLDEILGRKFDQCSGHDGLTLAADCSNNPLGSFRCDEAGVSCIAAIAACPASGVTAATEELDGSGQPLRALFNDVDDYHCLDQAGDAIEDALGQPLTGRYPGFRVEVQVAYAGTELGLAERAAKRISVTVTAPSGDAIELVGFRGNY